MRARCCEVMPIHRTMSSFHWKLFEQLPKSKKMNASLCRWSSLGISNLQECEQVTAFLKCLCKLLSTKEAISDKLKLGRSQQELRTFWYFINKIFFSYKSQKFIFIILWSEIALKGIFFFTCCCILCTNRLV